MYSIELSQLAQKFLIKIDPNLRKRIEKTLKKLESESVPSDAKFIGRDKSFKIFRLRIGKFRALYLLNEEDKIILITKIDKRSKIYE